MINEKIESHFNRIALEYDKWKKKNWYYYSCIKDFFRKNIPRDSQVLEIGCATGEILNSVMPSKGVGIDISENMIELASKKFPNLKFKACSDSLYYDKETFDYVIMCDLLDHIEDLWRLFVNTERMVHVGSKIVITTINPIWDNLLEIAEKFKLKMPEGLHNFIFKSDITNLLKLFSYEVESEGYFMLLPFYIPLVSNIFNSFLSKIPFLKQFCFVQYIVAKKNKPLIERKLSCSVIIPCFNEEENIEECVRSVPSLGDFTEIIVVDDGSDDKTKEKVEELSRHISNLRLISYPERRKKAYAVKRGFDAAKADVLMILDADMAVPPKELEMFFWAISKEGMDFINGTRMVYLMEEQAMPTLNRFGNKIFGIILSRIIGQKITDTLCGTKVLFKKHWEKMERTSSDSWGDFDLLIGAAKLNLKIVEIPIHYKKRLKGFSKMQPFKHGFLLFIRCLIGFKELKLKKWFRKT